MSLNTDKEYFLFENNIDLENTRHKINLWKRNLKVLLDYYIHTVDSLSTKLNGTESKPVK